MSLRAKNFLPLMATVILISIFGYFMMNQAQNGNQSLLSSPLVGKTAPKLDLPNLLQEDQPRLTLEKLSETKISILNVWASWCIPCRNEHPFLVKLKEKYPDVPIYGLNYKDTPVNAKEFIDKHGNPYALIGSDTAGTFGIEWGVYGVPETYILKTITLLEDAPPLKKGDKQVMIAYKHVGEISDINFESVILKQLDSVIKQ